MKFKSERSFSKSKFKLISNKKKIYLRKFLRSINTRDIHSLTKQNNFKDFKIKDFKVMSAKIQTSLSKIKKKKYYDMFFFEGKSGDEILLNANKNEIEFLQNWIKKFFFSFRIKNFYKLETYTYIDKLNDIVNKIKNKKFLKVYVNKHIPYFKNILQNNDIYYPKKNYCHGDLTLANIIINGKKKKLVLIDFLKTHNDNIVQDYSKLYQEFKLGWSGRYFNSIQSTRSLIVYQSIIKDSQWRSLDIKLKKSIIIETYMTLFRILPYVNLQDKITIKWIEVSLDKIKNLNLNLL